MTANNSIFYLSYLNKLADRYNNAYYHCINKENLIMLIILLWKFNVNDRVRVIKYNNIFSKVTLKIGQEKHLLWILLWKLIIGVIKLKI